MATLRTARIVVYPVVKLTLVTRMLTVVVSDPEPSVTVTVCTTAGSWTAVGVPEIRPVDAFSDSPVGRGGLMVNSSVPSPPEMLGVCAVIVEFLAAAIAEYPVVNFTLVTRTLTVVVSDEPPESLTVTVWVTAGSCTTLGVPEISPDDGLRVKPAGSAGEIEKVLMPDPPETAGI